MARIRKRLVNAGEVDALIEDADQALNSPAAEAAEATGGFAPGVQGHITAPPTAGAPAIPAGNPPIAVEGRLTPDEEDVANLDKADIEALRKRQRNEFFRKHVTPLGQQYGAGKVSMAELALKVVDAAAEGKLGPADAHDTYERFRAAADAKATLAGPDGEIIAPDETKRDIAPKQQVSKLRQFINLGVHMPEHGAEVMRRARLIHARLMTDDREAVREPSAYAALVTVARRQLGALAAPLTDEELNEALTRDAAEKTPADAAKKVLDALVSANAAYKGGRDRAPAPLAELGDAIHWLKQALAVLSPDALKAFEDKQARNDEKADLPLNTGPTPVVTTEDADTEE